MGYRKQQVLPGVTTAQPRPGLQTAEDARAALEAALARLEMGLQVQARVDGAALLVVAYGNGLGAEQSAAINGAAEEVRAAWDEVVIEFRLIDLNSALSF